MKIGDSISSYYRSQNSNQTNAGTAPGLSLLADSGEQRTQPPSISGGAASSSSLSAALWMSTADKLQSDAGGVTEAPVGNSTADEFMEWASMSMAEKIRAQILESKGLSEEDLAQMDADQRAAIEQEIKEAILRQLGAPEDSSKAEAQEASAFTSA